jgi:hypothetical protein
MTACFIAFFFFLAVVGMLLRSFRSLR